MVRFVSGGLTAVLICALTSGAGAQTSSARPSGDNNTLSDVVIEAVRPGVVRRIDRTSYEIKDDPQAQAAPLIDILGKLPSVSVGADGKPRLLGANGVRVQFDGKATQGTDVKLNSLTGADVERIEVITNPSSQFSAQGGAGIINIITRKRQRPGWSGSATAVMGSDGLEVRFSPSIARGKWTVGGTLSTSDRHYANDGQGRRDYLDAAGAVSGTRADTSRTRQKTDGTWNDLKVTYRPTDKQSLMLSASALAQDSDDNTVRDIRSAFAGAPSYVETRKNLWGFRARGLDLSYERQGPREGESLKMSANVDRWRSSGKTAFLNESAGLEQRFATRDWSLDDEVTLKLDYERPLDGKVLLTAGGQWERTDHDTERGFDNLSGSSGLGAPYVQGLTSRRETAAAYTTLQFPLLGWTVLPGVRYEDMSLDFRASGAGLSVHNRDLFPSLHVSRDLTKIVNVKVSYSRRVQHPSPDNLNPAIRWGGIDSLSSGNPDLKPIFTDAYEAKLTRAGKAVSLDATLYNRVSHSEFSWISQLRPDGVVISTPVNAGRVTQRGGQASLRGPIGARVKYVLTANLYQRDRELLTSGVTRRDQALSYDGSLQLDYKSPAPTSADAQRLQLSLRVFGPDQQLQWRSSGFYRADLTWRRPVTKKISAVLNVTDLFHTQKQQSRGWGDGYAYESESRSPTKARLSLTYALGGKP